MGFLAIRLERILDKVYDNISEQNAALNTVVQENLSGMRAVKSFAREDFEMEKFNRENDAYMEAQLASSQVWMKYLPGKQQHIFVDTVDQVGHAVPYGLHIAGLAAEQIARPFFVVEIKVFLKKFSVYRIACAQCFPLPCLSH